MKNVVHRNLAPTSAPITGAFTPQPGQTAQRLLLSHPAAPAFAANIGGVYDRHHNAG